MTETLRFIHAADLHLGRAFRSRDAETARACSDALLRAYENLVQAALDRSAAFVVLAGDVFDSGDSARLSPRVRLRFRRGLERLAREGVSVFIAPGNHDPCTPRSVWRAGILPEIPEVHLFDSMKPSVVELLPPRTPFPVVVHGVAHTQAAVGANLVSRIHGADDGRFHLAVVHASVESVEAVEETTPAEPGRYAPCAVADFRGRGIHYWALGHIHQARDFVDECDPLLFAGYCGCVQGLDPSETGPKGAYLVSIHQEDGRFRMEREHLELHEIEWASLRVDATGVAGIEDLAARIRAALEPRLRGRGRAAVRLELHGTVPAPGEFAQIEKRTDLESELRAELDLAWFEVRWSLAPALEAAELAGRDNVLGRLLARLQELESPGEEQAAALREVLRAVRPDLQAVPAEDAAAVEYLLSLLPEVRRTALARLGRSE